MKNTGAGFPPWVASLFPVCAAGHGKKISRDNFYLQFENFISTLFCSIIKFGIAMKKSVFAVAALFAIVGSAQAQWAAPAPSPLRPLVGLGLSGGGDELASVTYTNGDTYHVKAGALMYLTAGVDYRVSPQFSIQTTVNYHFDRANGKNGDIKFERFPIEVIGYYQPNAQWRVGGGVRYVSSAKLSSSGVIAGLDVKFDNTTSAVVEGEYFFGPKFGMKVRYVNETYKAAGYKDIKGNHVGVSGNYYF